MERFVFSNEARALAMLDHLKDAIRTYGVVTRCDVKQLYGITPNRIDEDWGWSDLDNASIGSGELEGEVVLCLPKPFRIA